MYCFIAGDYNTRSVRWKCYTNTFMLINRKIIYSSKSGYLFFENHLHTGATIMFSHLKENHKMSQEVLRYSTGGL